MTKQQEIDAQRCEELQEQGIDMDCLECSCNCCIAQQMFTPDYTELVQKCSDMLFKMSSMMPEDSFIDGYEELREHLNNVLGID